MGLYKWIWAPFFWIFIHELEFGPNPLLDQDKISIWIKNISHQHITAHFSDIYDNALFDFPKYFKHLEISLNFFNGLVQMDLGPFLLDFYS